MLALVAQTQNYAWGRLARSDSKVAELTAAAGGEVHPEKPYAELWMGTHPGGPCRLAASPDTTLLSWLQEHPEALGQAVLKRFGLQLPFLFKVLSVSTALSIQSHPDKRLAEQLHAERPEVYKDANHKPEMALAITDFEALCSFVPHSELEQVLAHVPEVQACIGAELVAQVAASGGNQASRRAALRAAFTALMTADESLVAGQVEALVQRLQAPGGLQQPGAPAWLASKGQLALRLHQHFPHDVGVLAAYFLNHIRLKPGQAIFLGANEPHAYVSGQLVECMATSDNVIRAGLTPKLRDTRVLCDSLTYSQGPPQLLHGLQVQEYTQLYQPPVDEFEVLSINLPAGRDTIIPANQGPMLLLVIQGAGQAQAHPQQQLLQGTAPALMQEAELRQGAVFFIAASASLNLTAAQDQGLQVWAAACNSAMLPDKMKLPAQWHMPAAVTN